MQLKPEARAEMELPEGGVLSPVKHRKEPYKKGTTSKSLNM